MSIGLLEMTLNYHPKHNEIGKTQKANSHFALQLSNDPQTSLKGISSGKCRLCQKTEREQVYIEATSLPVRLAAVNISHTTERKIPLTCFLNELS